MWKFNSFGFVKTLTYVRPLCVTMALICKSGLRVGLGIGLGFGSGIELGSGLGLG